MSALFDGATITVEVAFGDAPLTANASCTWTDITDDVRSIAIRRGRDSELGTYSPGSCNLQMDNRTRRYDPSNTGNSAPYLGNLLPMRKLRVKATSGATTATIFTGHVLGWPIEYPGMKDSIVTLTAVDAFRPLTQMEPPHTAYEAEVLGDTPAGYWRLDLIDEGGFSPATAGNFDARNFNRGDPSFFDPADLTITQPAGVESTIANAGWVVENFPTAAPKSIEGWWWNLYQGIYAGTNIARAALDSTNWIRVAIGNLDGTVSVGYSNSADNRYFAYASTGFVIVQPSAHIVLTADTTNLTLYLNGLQVWQGALSVGTSTNTFAALPPPSVQAVVQPRAGSTISPGLYGLAVYSGSLTSTQASDHYQAGLTGWGHPTGDRAGDRINRILDAVGWPIAVSSIATGGTTTTLTDSTKSWTTNFYAGSQIRIVGGTGRGQTSTIASNTATQLTVSPAWVTAPDSTSAYIIDADRSISTGSTVLGTFTNGSNTLQACQQVADVEQGLFFIDGAGNVVLRDRQWQWTNSAATTAQATFGDSTGETGYADIQIDGNHLDYLRNVVTVSYSAGAVVVKDATSVAAYGEQSDSVSANFLPTWGGYVARQLGAFRLRARKDVATRIPMIRIKPRKATSTYLPTLLGLELGERVVVNRRPTGGSGSFSLSCTVQGIHHNIATDNWTTTLYLSPILSSYTEAPYLTMGDATYGKIGATAANKVPY